MNPRESSPDGAPRPIRHPKTASRLFNGTAVVISPAENVVRMMNTVGSRIWQLADGTRSEAEIAARLVAEFDVDEETARRSVADFLAALAEKGLIEG